MTNTTLPPDWAIQRAIDLRMQENPMLENCLEGIKQKPFSYPAMLAFARYIEQHEKPPVDPLLIEAREIVASEWESRKLEDVSQKIRDGKLDSDPAVKCVYLVLSRGK